MYLSVMALELLFLDGAYAYRDNRPPRFQRVKAPDKGELEDLVQLISKRVGRCLERQGLLEHGERLPKANGFSLHAGVSCEGHERNKRERLCRYIARPAVAVPRLSLSSTGKVVYTLKTLYRDGATLVAFDRGGHPAINSGRAAGFFKEFFPLYAICFSCT